jgi:hypothetical protein
MVLIERNSWFICVWKRMPLLCWHKVPLKTHTVILCKKKRLNFQTSFFKYSKSQLESYELHKHLTYIHFISIVSSRRFEGQNNVFPLVFISGVGLHFVLCYVLHVGLKVAFVFVYNFRNCNFGGSFTFLAQQNQL